MSGALQQVLFGMNGTPSTSYSNAGGTGDRTASITVTESSFLDEGAPGTGLIDGSQADGSASVINGGAVTNNWIKFNFGSNKIITETKNTGSSTATETAVFKWQGSTDDSAWTDLATGVSPGFSNAGVLDTSLSANTGNYQYYRLIGTSGTFSTGGIYWREIEFKISA